MCTFYNNEPLALESWALPKLSTLLVGDAHTIMVWRCLAYLSALAANSSPRFLSFIPLTMMAFEAVLRTSQQHVVGEASQGANETWTNPEPSSLLSCAALASVVVLRAGMGGKRILGQHPAVLTLGFIGFWYCATVFAESLIPNQGLGDTMMN